MANYSDLPDSFYLGCAVWSYQGWVGNFYPPKTRPSEFLSLYSQHFNAVEGNTTFYAIPNPSTIQRWRSQTPPNFRFCPKFPKTITHQGLLTPQISTAQDFLTIMPGLGDRLGLVFAQLPPHYSPVYFDDLQQFLADCSQKNISLALEVRHPDWFTEANSSKLNQMLTELGITRVLLDTRPIYNSPDDPQLNSSRRKPQLPLKLALTSETSMVRFISHPNSKYNQSYLQEWVTIIDRWLSQGKTTYFFVHCPIEERSPDTANTFYRLLQQQNPQLPPVTGDQTQFFPTQLKLF